MSKLLQMWGETLDNFFDIFKTVTEYAQDRFVDKSTI